MANVHITKYRKSGNSHYIILTKEVRDQLQWNLGDTLAVRIVSGRLICERLSLETLAKPNPPAEVTR